MMRSKITRILSYKHQKHQKNYSTFRQFSNYTHHSALFRGAKLRNSGTPKGQVTVLIYDNTLLLYWTRACPRPRPLAYCPPGRCFSLSSNPRALPSVTHGSALQAPERIQVLIFTTDLTNRTDSCPIWEQNINQKKPLARMESVALMLCFRSGLIRASS